MQGIQFNTWEMINYFDRHDIKTEKMNEWELKLMTWLSKYGRKER